MRLCVCEKHEDCIGQKRQMEKRDKMSFFLMIRNTSYILS